MNFDKHLREMAAHLLLLAKTPGWREYARQREKELIASHPMYEVLPELIPQLRQSAPTEPSSSGMPSSRP